MSGMEVRSYPVTSLQHDILLDRVYARASGVHVVQLWCGLRGALDGAALEHAWERLVAQHPVLRTAMRWHDDTNLSQVVFNAVAPLWEQQDWRDRAASERRDLLATFLDADRARDFDIATPPLARVTLIRQDDDAWTCVLTVHRLILDGWSCERLLSELWQQYAASLSGHGPRPLVPEPVSFEQYVACLERHDRAADEAFWRHSLGGFTTPTRIETGHAAAPGPREAAGYAEQEVELSESQTTALSHFLSARRLTLTTLVQGVWAVLLARYTREDDVVFGAVVPNRPSALAGATAVIGQCTTTVPVRATVRHEMGLEQWLREVEARQAEALAHAAHPLATLQGWSDVPKDRPLFESLLLFDAFPLPAPGADLTRLEAHTLQRTSFPLTVIVVPGASLAVRIVYDRSRFEEAAITRLAGHVRTLLASIPASSGRRIAELPMLTAAERRQVVTEWNATQAAFPVDRCVHTHFEEQVARTPDAIAVVSADGEQLTYQQVNARANQLAHHLRALGVGPDVLVGLCVRRSLEMVVGMLGILKAGGAYVPLDPDYPTERLTYMLEDAHVPVLLTQQHLTQRLRAPHARTICLDMDWPRLAEERVENPASAVTPDHLAYVIYTSGSTGRPKGVMIPHRSLVNHNFAIIRHYALRPTDRVLQFASISFDAAAEEMFPFWLCGAAVILRSDQVASSFQALLETTERHRVTVLDLPTAYWHEWVVELTRSPVPLPQSVRLVVIGGEKALPERFAAWTRVVGRHIALINSYGPTEATITATSYDPPDYEESIYTHAMPIGRPLANVRTYVLDRYLHPVPVGVAGELYIGGSGLARGYLHRPELTAERFIPDPFSETPGERIYKTGDLVFSRADGTLEYLGRLDDQVKIRGFRIELGEIESALTRHPAVREAVVVAREDDPAEPRLVAYVVAEHEPAPSRDALAGYLKEHLPSYMVPSAFQTLAALPLTPSGKVDRRALPAPEPSTLTDGHDFVPPRLTLHHQLAAIWEELLDVRPIGIRDNFFDLGGHSLLAARMVDRVEQMSGKRIALPAFYTDPTIEHLTRVLLRSDGEQAASPLVRVQAGSGIRPFFFLHGDLRGGGFYCWNLARQLGPEQPFYALEPHGVGDGPLPHSIPAMAAAHLALVRAVQPEGPYRLGGFCNGGLVAFEMAQQLMAAGQEVECLFLVNPATASTRQRVALRTLRRAGELVRLDHDTQFAWYLRLRRSRDKYWLDLEKGGMVRPAESPRPEIWAAYDWAMANYQPRRYPGHLTLVWSRQDIERERGDPDASWRRLAASVESSVIPGTHNASVTRHVDVVAAHLAAGLDRPVRRVADIPT